jgi:hypothetical protein
MRQRFRGSTELRAGPDTPEINPPSETLPRPFRDLCSPPPIPPDSEGGGSEDPLPETPRRARALADVHVERGRAAPSHEAAARRCCPNSEASVLN